LNLELGTLNGIKMDLKTRLAAGLLVLSVLWPKAQLTAHDEIRPPDAAGAELDLEQRLGSEIPLELAFTDENGRARTLGEFFDRTPVLLVLVYYDCPQICPLVLEGLARSLRAVNFAAGDQYRVIAVSIDPHETPQLAAHKKRALMARSRPGDSEGWHLLTGQQSEITRLAHAAGFRYKENQRSGPARYIHPAGALVLTPDGRISRYLYGFDYPPRDLRFALIEASGNRIGSPVDRLLLLCYEYDPRTGKYTITVLNILRMSGAATVVALGGGLALMLRRERHRPARSAREDA